MKKVRKIKILLTTREILVTGSGTQNPVAERADLSVCPVCSSHLSEPLPVSVETINLPDRIAESDNLMTAEN